MNKLKQCNKCGINKNISWFYIKINDYRLSICKECYREREKKYNKKYRENNKNKIKKSNKRYYENNKEVLNKISQKYYKNNREKFKEISKEYYKNNKSAINKYYKNKRKTDILYKLSSILRIRLNTAIKKNYKSGSAVKDLGCSINKLKHYLEKQFYLHPKTNIEMTWENYGLFGWHIDHIKPLCSFDLTDRKQFLEACNYTNLQPLWIEDHNVKTTKDLYIRQQDE